MFTMNNLPDIQFTLNIPLKSKARPRFANGHAYLPKDYREWKRLCRQELKNVFTNNGWVQITQAKHISISFYGHARHDLDNLVGAVLDAGISDSNGFGAWTDDRVTVFPSLCASYFKSSVPSIDVSIWL